MSVEFNQKIADKFNVTFAQWHAPAELTNGNVAVLLYSTAQHVREEIDKATAPLKARLEEMETFHYRGVWKEGEEYRAGNFVTLSGSLWHCNCTTKSRPGENHVAWTLAVKRGSNGKDAKAASEPLRTEPRLPSGIPARRIG